jgi:nucleoside-diphosphate-sugar epimerase
MGEDTVTQVGFVELIAEVMGRPVELVPFDPARLRELGKTGPVFGQNLVYECHAVHTTHKLRRDLGLRPRYTLASGLAHTWRWYREQGLAERAVDFALEDQLLAALRA